MSLASGDGHLPAGSQQLLEFFLVAPCSLRSGLHPCLRALKADSWLSCG